MGIRRVRRPQGRYLIALEHVFGLPVASLGFDADIRYGMDRGRTISEAGLDAAMPLPEPAESYGPLSGIWLSTYEYLLQRPGRRSPAGTT